MEEKNSYPKELNHNNNNKEENAVSSSKKKYAQNYFLTCNRGMNEIVGAEVVWRFNAEILEMVEGKCIFGLDNGFSPRELLNVRSAERAFILVHFVLFSNSNSNSNSCNIPENIEDGSKFIAEILSKKNWKAIGLKYGESNFGYESSNSKFPIDYKICCKSKGKYKALFNSLKLASALSKKFKPDPLILRQSESFDPDNLEIYLHLSDTFLCIGIPLFRRNKTNSKEFQSQRDVIDLKNESRVKYVGRCEIGGNLAKRPFVMHHRLRSTVAWIMAILAQIKPFEVVLDPMCGSGTILFEALNLKSDPRKKVKIPVVCIGSDLNESQIQILRENVNKYRNFVSEEGKTSNINFNVESFVGDANFIPFKGSTIDVILIDAPFGLKHICKSEVHDLKKSYADLFNHFHFVLRNGGRVVILVFEDHFQVLCESLHLDLFKQREIKKFVGKKRKLSDDEQKRLSRTSESKFSNEVPTTRINNNLKFPHYILFTKALKGILFDASEDVSSMSNDWSLLCKFKISLGLIPACIVVLKKL